MHSTKLIGLCATFVFSQAAAGWAQDSGAAITLADLQAMGSGFPTDLAAGASQTELANYAWRLFIAANQRTDATLASPAGRTDPSASSSFLDSGAQPSWDNPLVFEGFYHRSEAYPYYTSGNRPQPPIDQAPVYRFQNDFTVTGGQFVNLDETNEISQNFMYYRMSNDPDFEVLYMAKVNADEVNYAWDRAVPSRDAAWDFPPIIEIKAAWRRVSDIKNSDPSTYHQAVATYYTGTEGGTITATTDTFALIGLHIIQKTPNYPTFIFTTFEHVDAVTRDGSGKIVDPAYQLTYQTLDYGTGEPTSPTATATGAYTVNAPGLPTASDAAMAYDLPAAGSQPAGQPGAFQVVVQPKTITSEVNDVNNSVHQLIVANSPGNIWANYRLKGVQGIPTSDETSLDFFLANIVIESSQPGVQLFKGGVSGAGTATFTNTRSMLNVTTGPLTSTGGVGDPQFLMGGCMGCHGAGAQQKGRDFSFLAQHAAGGGVSPDPVASPSLSPAELMQHQSDIAQRRGETLFGN